MSTRTDEAAEEFIESTIIAAVSIGLVVAVLFFVGFEFSLSQLVWLFIIFVVLGVFTRRATDFNVGFTILTIGVVFTLTDFIMPEFLLDPFTPIVVFFADITGLDVRLIDGFEWLVLGTFFTAVALGAKYRLTGGRKFIMPIVNRVAADFARFIDVYVTSARILVLLMVTAVIIMMQQAGFLLGDLGNLAAQSPFVVSNLFTLLVGYLSLGGELPFIGSIPLLGGLTPIAFIVLGILAIIVAAASSQEGTGPISQFVDRL